MAEDPGPNPEEMDGPLDVQWVAGVLDDEGNPTPAAGDTTSPEADWIKVEDPGFEDAEPVTDEDGDTIE